MKTKIVLLLLVCSLVLCGCSSKTPIDSEKFISVAQEYGFEVDKGESDDECVLEAYGAVQTGMVVQFYVTEDSYSKVLFNASKKRYNEQNSVKVMSTEINVGEYHYCSFTGEDKFYILAAVEDTYISCIADKDKKDEAIELFEAIGYK